MVHGCGALKRTLSRVAINQSINQYSFVTAWQILQANNSRQKGSTVSKEKACLDNKPKNWAYYVFLYSMRVRKLESENCVECSGSCRECAPWCIAKNGGGYTQRGVAKGLTVPCLFMITEVSVRCQKNPEVGIRRIPAYTPQYTTVN